jgi:hypothetical protein
VLYWGKIGASWGFTFALFSVILFAASMLSLRESVEVKPKMAVRGKKRSRRKKR